MSFLPRDIIEKQEILSKINVIAKYRKSYTLYSIAQNNSIKNDDNVTNELCSLAEDIRKFGELKSLVEANFANNVLNQKNSEGQTPLCLAVLSNNLEGVRLLVSQPVVNINEIVGINDRTALFIASMNGFVEIVILLCSIPGVDIGKRDKLLISPYNAACVNFHSEPNTTNIKDALKNRIQKILLMPILSDNLKGYTKIELSNNKSKAYKSEVENNIYNNVSQNKPIQLQALVGAWFNSSVLNRIHSGPNGPFTPLMCACFFGYTDCVKILVSQPGIDINLSGSWGYTPLIYACLYGHVGVVEVLCSHIDIDVNKTAASAAASMATAHNYVCVSYSGKKKQEISDEIDKIIENNKNVKAAQKEMQKKMQKKEQEEEQEQSDDDEALANIPDDAKEIVQPNSAYAKSIKNKGAPPSSQEQSTATVAATKSSVIPVNSKKPWYFLPKSLFSSSTREGGKKKRTYKKRLSKKKRQSRKYK